MTWSHSGLKSRVNVAKKDTPSLKTTIPQGIASFLELRPGDDLLWNMEIIDNSKIVTIKPIRSELSPRKQSSFMEVINLNNSIGKGENNQIITNADQELLDTKELAKIKKFLK